MFVAVSMGAVTSTSPGTYAIEKIMGISHLSDVHPTVAGDLALLNRRIGSRIRFEGFDCVGRDTGIGVSVSLTLRSYCCCCNTWHRREDEAEEIGRPGSIE